MSIEDILKVAENFEIEGFKFYKEKKEEVKNKLAREVLEFLQEMEKEHTEYIRKIRKALEKEMEIPVAPLDTTKDFFNERLKGQKIEETPSEDDIKDLSILRMALLIEKDFVNYYDKAAERAKVMENKTLESILINLREWEKGHVNLVKELILQIFEKNRLDLGFYPF
ncbi:MULTISPECIES: ferritin family protein [unclassified Thermosipho (in: thermotogales)]|uniref:ferritin family protein n=1 Tax=unclassified Thermosipho (in: thermotogales) TaxID=2676525 RepID=UPI000985FD5B|nr:MULTISPECIES: ferritin family protein [unclassified Thermosipho (in: thermotogales)]MBT1247611.1 rubrerythrin [Thermosipho sp. 1244]OOC46153.1 rubrerythrin [Thermosipho sp. 1223]